MDIKNLIPFLLPAITIDTITTSIIMIVVVLRMSEVGVREYTDKIQGTENNKEDKYYYLVMDKI